MIKDVNVKITYDNLASDHNCLICGKPTEIRSAWRNTETKERGVTFFTLCEKCKLEKNCFTCWYSLSTHMRYKGMCDKNWELLKLRLILEEGNEEKVKNFLKHFNIENVDMNSLYDEVVKKICDYIENYKLGKFPDCRLYKAKKLGKTIKDYWDHKPCGRHKRADPTKEEFDDFNNPY